MEETKLKIKLIPNSPKNQIIGFMGDVLKIKITAPPVDNKANKALIEFLSKELKIAKSKIEIIKGQKSRNKVLKIEGRVSWTI